MSACRQVLLHMIAPFALPPMHAATAADLASLDDEVVVGKGSYATVVKRKCGGETYIAVKRPRKGAERVAHKEWEFLRNVRHDNILTPHWFDSDKGDMAMPLADSDLLEVLLSEQVVDIKSIRTGIASAIEYLHRKGIVHLDIKPENILIA